MDLILLAAETAEEGGGGSMTAAVVIMLVALAVFAIAYLVVGPGKKKAGAKRRGDIPLAMRPYHSDEELETTALERAMSWGVALSMFAAVFLAVYWLIEPERINDKQDGFYEEAVARGQVIYVNNCATCHGNDAGGGSAPNPYSDAPWPAPNLTTIQARFEDSDIVPDIRDFIETTIKQGRLGTPMPAWGAAYNGPLNDFEVNELVEYILAIQQTDVEEAQAFEGALGDGAGDTGEEVWTNNCARCHGDDLQGQVGPQLQNLFERYGWDPDAEDADQAAEEVRELIRGTLENGRYVPTGAIMPPFANVLNEAQIEAVMDYIFENQVTGGPRYGQIGGDPQPADEASADAEGEE